MVALLAWPRGDAIGQIGKIWRKADPQLQGTSLRAPEALIDLGPPPLKMSGPSFETAIVLFGVGIALYFAASYEPILLPLGLGICGVGAAAFFLRRRDISGTIALGLFMVLLGIFRAALHTDHVAAPILSERSQVYTVTGWAEGIEPSGSGFRLRINVTQMEQRGKILPPNRKPVRVRVKLKDALTVEPGTLITLKAMLSGPTGPAIARGYDPARTAYFEQIAGNGFAISGVEILPQQGEMSFARYRTLIRGKVADRIRASAPPQTAELQVALLTGERARIPAAQVQTLRVTGLAHILAISGLHMGLIAGGAYFFLCLALASIEPLARRHDVRQIAAFIALIVATIYLLLSTGTVSAQRAYIMAFVAFLAILLGRPALSIRTVAVAAFITLALHPEALVSAGFQMSFAAATALIAVYSLWRERFPARYGKGWLSRIMRNLAGVSVTSLVAGTATGVFAGLHFHHMSRFGFLANIIAMPVFTAIVMPAGLVAMVAMPFGLEALPLQVMGKGLDVILWLMQKIEAWPGSHIAIAGAPGWVLPVYGFGFVWLCLGPWRRRVFGSVLMLGALLAWPFAKLPDMRISEKAELSFIENTAQGTVLYVRRPSADRYGREMYLERAGYGEIAFEGFEAERAACDGAACKLLVKGKSIAVAFSGEEAFEECASADLVVMTERSAGPVVRRACEGKLVDLRRLYDEGAIDVFLSGPNPVLRPANPDSRKARPWGRGEEFWKSRLAQKARKTRGERPNDDRALSPSLETPGDPQEEPPFTASEDVPD